MAQENVHLIWLCRDNLPSWD